MMGGGTWMRGQSVNWPEDCLMGQIGKTGCPGKGCVLSSVETPAFCSRLSGEGGGVEGRAAEGGCAPPVRLLGRQHGLFKDPVPP